MRQMYRRFVPSTICAILTLTHYDFACAYNVTWTSPSSGDVYRPGDNLVSEWTTDQAVESPSFNLCFRSSSVNNSRKSVHTRSANCGDSISPSVSRSGPKYAVTLAVPTVTKEAIVYLRMQGNSGTYLSSPDFSLSPTQVSGSGDTGNTSQSQPSSPLTTTGGAAHSNSAPTTSIQAASGDGNSELANSAFSPLIPSATGSPTNSAARAHTTSPVVVAIPIAVVGAALLATLAVWIHHRRSLAKRREEQEASYVEKNWRDKYTSFTPVRKSINQIAPRNVERAIPRLSEKQEPSGLHRSSTSSTHSSEKGHDFSDLLSQSRSEHFGSSRDRRPEARRDVRRELSQMPTSRSSDVVWRQDPRISDASTLPNRIARSKSRTHWTYKRRLFSANGDNESFYEENSRPSQPRHSLPSRTRRNSVRGSIDQGNVHAIPGEINASREGETSQNVPRRPPKGFCMPAAPLSAYAQRDGGRVFSHGVRRPPSSSYGAGGSSASIQSGTFNVV